MLIFIPIGLVVLIAVVIMMAATYSTAPRMSRSLNDYPLSLSNRQKSVYGGYIAYKLLPEMFDNTPANVVTKPFARTYLKDDRMQNGSRTAYVLLAKELYASNKDVQEMLSYVEAGNQLFVAALGFDSAFLEAFRFKAEEVDYDQDNSLKIAQQFVNPELQPQSFRYKGIVTNTAFTELDTAVTTILGTNVTGEANLIRITRGNGQLFISLNPYTFTNYYLATGNNRQSLEHMMTYLRPEVDALYWDEYYKHLTTRPPSDDFSNFQVLMRYPAMRWALFLALLLLLLYAAFESKRRQRIIPPKQPLANTSLEFVKTLGALYYSHHNNLNLAQKMSAQLLEHVRTNLNLNTSVLDEAFIHRLARKSNHPQEEVEKLIRTIDHIRLANSLSDEELKSFYKSVYHFYQKTN